MWTKTVDLKIKTIKKLLSFLFCVLMSFSAFCQELALMSKSSNFYPDPEKKFSLCEINFGFPFSTITYDEGLNYTVALSVNVAIGSSKNVNGLAVSGLYNMICNNACGLQIAGGANDVIGNAYGISVAGLCNLAEYYYGIQVAGLCNAGKNSLCGIQIAGLFNLGKKANGLMISGVGNFTGSSLNGVQITGVTNYAKEMTGLQLSGIANIAGDVKGLQFAGIMNKAKKVKGVQFATLVNIAEESNFPIALVNIIKNGKMGVALTHDILNNKVVSFRSGGKYTYGILGFGFNKKISEGNKLVAEAGYGIHIPITKWLEINNEFKATTMGFNSEKTTNNFGYLLAPSFTIFEHYNIFAGVSVNYFNSNSDNLMADNCFWSKDGDDYIHRMYVGYQIGVQYVF